MKKLAYVVPLCVLMAACGGGGGDGEAVAPPPPPADPNLFDLSQAQQVLFLDGGGDGGDGSGDSGVGGAAGDGSPLGRATVFLTDSQGKTVSGQTDSKGGYLLRFKSAEFKPPFVVKVVDSGGSVLGSATEIGIPAGKATRVNINPLTDKVLSDVLATTTGGTDKAFSGTAVNTAALQQAKANLVTSVREALAVAGVADVERFDPVRSAYRYDGTGVDAVIESIAHTRAPTTGQTQLVAKLAPLVTNPDGTVVPALITAATPLPAAQVAVPGNPTLTFTKISSWITAFNNCLDFTPPEGFFGRCSGTTFGTLVGGPGEATQPKYRHSSRDFDEDFRTLCSDVVPNRSVSCIPGSQLRNPAILFIGRYSGSSTDNLAVVEVTVRQPRTGPLSTNLNEPVEYTKVLVFRRDDTSPGLAAGNWVLYGNQRAFDWSVEPRYFSTLQQTASRNVNGPGGDPSFMKAGLALNFSSSVWNPVTRTYDPAHVYAVRFKGPGLPAQGLVMVPQAGNLAAFAVYSKVGEVPVAGTTTRNVQVDFRLQGVVLPTREVIHASAWPDNPAHAASPTSDVSGLTAYSAYTAEVFRENEPTVTETARILAPVQSASVMAGIPLHDLSPSLPELSTSRPSSSSVVVRWNRTPGATRITSAFALLRIDGISTTRGATVPDGLTDFPTSTSVTVSTGSTPADAGSVSEVGLSGRAARSVFVHSIRR